MILKDYVTGKLLFNHPPPSVLAEYTEAFELQGVEEVLEKRAKAKADGVAHLSAAIQADMEAYEAAGYVSVFCICVFLSFLLFSLSSFLPFFLSSGGIPVFLSCALFGVPPGLMR